MKTDERTCKNPNCGKIHSKKEVKRVYGEESMVYYAGYCSAQCYTQATITNSKKPSDFKKASPMGSVFQKAEAETVANNIMKILERTGNEWRKLTYDEYKEERLKDGNYSSGEEKYFNDVIDYCLNPCTAKLFAPDWRSVFEKV